MEDRLLCRMIDKDPEKGWGILMDQYSGLLYYIVRGILIDPGDTEETVSEVFLEAWQKWQDLDLTRGSLKSWLAVIASRRAIDRRRKIKPQLELKEEIAASETTILDGIIQTEEKSQVLARLEALSEPDRSLIIGRYFLDLTAKEMALQFKMTPNTIDQRISRALRSLRTEMEASYGYKE